MKTFLCVIIVFVCGVVGINIKNDFYKKYQFYAEINAFLHFISIQIAFFNNVYADCINTYIQNNKLKNKQFFVGLLNLVQTSNLEKDTFVNLINLNITTQEKEELYKIFSSIGTTDAIHQNTILSGYIKQTENKLNQLAILKKTKGDVIGKLGICVGLVICILIY